VALCRRGDEDVDDDVEPADKLEVVVVVEEVEEEEEGEEEASSSGCNGS
jgi:hypothetical protein